MINRRKIIFFSHLIVNKYILKNNEIDKFKDIIQSYYDEHKKKFDDFTVCVMWKKIDMPKNRISFPRTITLQKPYLFETSMIELPIVLRVSPIYFLYTFDGKINTELNEINIIFVSDLRDIPFSRYATQPKSMLCRKLVKIFLEENYGNFDYNWLPKCFRNINT